MGERLNNASFRQKFDSEKYFSTLRPSRASVEDISTFDGQNPVVGSLLQELDIGKKDLVSERIKTATRPDVDLDIQK